MNSKPSLAILIRRWAFFLLIALAAVLMAAHTVKTIKESEFRATQMRAQYLERQKKIIKSETLRFAGIIEHEMEKSLSNARTQVKARVLAAHAMARNIYEQNKGSKTGAEIQKIIIDGLRPMRLDQEGGYYFITDFNGIIKLFADRPDQEQISLLEHRDTRGRYVIKELIRIARSQGEGFSSYNWTKPGQKGNDHKKLAYVKKFAPFDWVIGTGVYLDDLESDMQQAILEYARHHRFGPNGSGYVFAYELLDIRGGDDFARIYANPNLPEATGKLISDDFKDPRGKAFRKEALKGLKETGECYVDYWYKKINDPEPKPKTSFFKLAGNNRFMVAAGIYLDDVEDQIRLMQADLDRQLRQGFLIICVVFAGALLVVLIQAGRMNLRLEKDFEIFASFFRLAAETSQPIDKESVRFSELDWLAGFANRMIAQKTEAEKDLKATRDRLNQAQEVARVGHYLYDIKNDAWTSSKALDSIFGIDGLSKKDMAQWIDIVHPEDREKMAAYLTDHVLTRHQKFDLEYRIIDPKTGKEKWVHGLGELKFNEENEAVEMFGTIQDISERRQMDRSLRLTRFIFDKAAVGIFQITSDGNILQVNEKAAQDLGYTVEELSGMSVFDINPTITLDDIDTIWQPLAKKGSHSFETIHCRKDGRRFPVEVVSNLIEYDGSPTSISFIRDITERKQAEDALKKSQERLSGIVESMADWIWEIDADGRYLYCSSKVKTILGYYPWEMIGRPPFDFMPPDEAKKIRGIFNDAAARKEVIRDLENWNLAKDKKAVCLLTNGVPIMNDSGDLLGYRGVDRDITDRKTAEKEKRALENRLQQSQKMETIGTLAGGIAHDFNNILSGILGYSQLATAHIDDPDKVGRHIRQITKGCRRATDLTKQILTFSRQSEYEKHPFKIYIEVKEALKLIRSSIPSTIEINTRLESDKKVLADPVKIHQVIMNLCTNAHHAMRKSGGCLSVSLTDIVFCASDMRKNKKKIPGDYVRLEIRDTGHGMDKAMLEKIFEPYFTTKEKGDGTGLGLALVQAIVEEHDGFLEVKSQIGRGTSFELYFPTVGEDPGKAPKDETPEPLRLGTETIMVVDDEDQIRESFKESLEDLGYKVVTFPNGRDALDAFREDPEGFDFIITDMTMPEFTGDKLAVAILKLRPDIPVVLCTGFSDTISRAAALDLGIREFVQKPILHQDLAALIRKILDDAR